MSDGGRRPQVLIGAMPQLLGDLIRRALSEVDAEIVPADAGWLDGPDDDGRPVVVILADEGGPATVWERELLLDRPDTVILLVRGHGHTFTTRALFPLERKQVVLADYLLCDAVSTAPRWDERFAEGAAEAWS